ncbi:MAG TPA: DUF2892 domain-containing protein [Myxococcota bacterium]|nr:DUF2892 domain-containing protein [Myxococcota bacterium]
MKVNEGTADRVIRVVVGLAILSAVVLVEGQARWLGLIGLVPLVTGLIGYCPVYGLIGFNTCPLKRA